MHQKLLESTIAQCRAYIDAGDCHGPAPHVERLIEAVVQLAGNVTGSAAGHTTAEFSNLSNQAHGYGVPASDGETFPRHTPAPDSVKEQKK